MSATLIKSYSID